MNSYFFHPHEFAFVGYSHSGKTTLDGDVALKLNFVAEFIEVLEIKHL